MTRLALAAGLGLLLAAPATALAAPVTGSVFGPVTSVKGASFVLTSALVPKGRATVEVGAKTVITEQITARRSSLRVGACVSALGSRSAKGVVAATRVTVSAPVGGSCDVRAGGRRRPGIRPGGGTSTPPRRPGGGGGFFGGNGSFGFAFGAITAAKGSTLTVTGTRGGAKTTTTVTVSARTRLDRTIRVEPAGIHVGSCAFVDGTSTNRGVTVDAQRIGLTPKVNGACTTGFRRPPGNG